MYVFASNWQAGDKVSRQLIVAMSLVPGLGSGGHAGTTKRQQF
jgi:hypothetical protein